jgi:hypothetical protein
MQSEETRASLLQRNPKRTDRHLSRDYGRSPCSKGAACSSPFGAIGERLAAVCLGSRICLSVSSARNSHWCCYLGTTLDMCTPVGGLLSSPRIYPLPQVQCGGPALSMAGWGPLSSKPHLAAGSRALDDGPVSPGQGWAGWAASSSTDRGGVASILPHHLPLPARLTPCSGPRSGAAIPYHHINGSLLPSPNGAPTACLLWRDCSPFPTINYLAPLKQ